MFDSIKVIEKYLGNMDKLAEKLVIGYRNYLIII